MSLEKIDEINKILRDIGHYLERTEGVSGIRIMDDNGIVKSFDSWESLNTYVIKNLK